MDGLRRPACGMLSSALKSASTPREMPGVRLWRRRGGRWKVFCEVPYSNRWGSSSGDHPPAPSAPGGTPGAMSPQGRQACPRTSPNLQRRWQW
eukprot:gene15422-biopygen18706